MIDEMHALEHNGTWALVPLPPHKKLVGCRWVYVIKGYTQVQPQLL